LVVHCRINYKKLLFISQIALLFVHYQIAINEAQFVKQLREEIPVKYRTAGKLILINFRSEIKQLTATKQIERVSKDWFTETQI
jgi:hypothetical protein